MDNLKSNEFYIFKVSFSDRIWRKVRVSADVLLDSLSDVILESFGIGAFFTYAFCMGNANFPIQKQLFWSPYLFVSPQPKPTTEDVTLKTFNFKKDDSFGYFLSSNSYESWAFNVVFLEAVKTFKGLDVVLEAKGEVPKDIKNKLKVLHSSI